MKLLYFLFVILISSAYTFAAVYKVVKKTDGDLNIRKAASNNGEIVGHLKNGQYIWSNSSSGVWIKFYKGYSHKKYLKEQVNNSNYKMIEDFGGRVAPSRDAKIAYNLKTGTKITAFGRDPFSNGWFVTSKGYIPTKYVKKITTTTVPPLPPTPPPPTPEQLATTLLISEEGVGKYGVCGAYIDSLGYPTIGYGQLCEYRVVSTKAEADAACSKYSNGCTPEKASQWLTDTVKGIVNNCVNKYSAIGNAYNKASNKRKAVIISMAYQMGCDGLAEFTTTLGLMASGDWAGAASHMLESLWAKQTPERAGRHATVIRTDTCSDFCGRYQW